MTHRSIVWFLACSFAMPAAAQQAAPSTLTPYQSLGRDLLRELVETNTAVSVGSTTKAAELLAARFRAAGFPAGDVQVVGPDTGADAKDRNLVVRYRGAGRRAPVMLIGHLDVVEANRADWARDPFTLVEHDGHFYGRGTLDMKNGDAAWVAALLRMKKEGVVPAGDYVLALTAGEEEGGNNGVQWLLEHRHDLFTGLAYVLNADAGGGELHDGKPVAMDVQAAEKVFQSYELVARNPGGHSSQPRKDNAIYALAAALGRVAAYEFPFQTNAVTRAYFTRTASLGEPAMAADLRALGASETPDPAVAARVASHSAYMHAQLRTTCVATMLQGGHAPNALPQRASAIVNCRILPGVDPAEVERALRAAVSDTSVALTPVGKATPSPPSPLPPAVERTMQSVVTSMWGPLPIVPDMETGATDGLFIRNAGLPVYGVSGLFVDPNIPEDTRAHGLDERIGVKSYYDQLEFTYRLLKAL
jgi:acetylornithine deacetylase/succinyl-diaminopimelate desuccinylase-like protein